MYLIAGLGNPGKKYTYTRHNVGFMVISELQEKLNISNNSVKQQCNGLIANTFIDQKKVMLCEPLTFMNLSGDCIACLKNYYKIPVEDIIIIYDDVDLPLGEVRVRRRGGPGTHNGMKSIVYSLDSTDFPRIRVGTGPVPENTDLIDFVLSTFSKEQFKILDRSIEIAAKAAELIVTEGIDNAMNDINRLNRLNRKSNEVPEEF